MVCPETPWILPAPPLPGPREGQRWLAALVRGTGRAGSRPCCHKGGQGHVPLPARTPGYRRARLQSHPAAQPCTHGCKATDLNNDDNLHVAPNYACTRFSLFPASRAGSAGTSSWLPEEPQAESRDRRRGQLLGTCLSRTRPVAVLPVAQL